MLAAWLEARALSASREEHRERFSIMTIPFQVREEARGRLLALPGGADLAREERPRDPGEGPEPRLVPMGF